MTLTRTFRSHWPEYLIEAWALGTFMVSAGVFTVLIDAPGSAVGNVITDPALRRALIGAAMGLTAMALIYSPWGRRSGAHMNPAVTVSFLTLRRTRADDALFYVLAQFGGGVLGVLAVERLLGAHFSSPPVSYVQTVPGPDGVAVAFALELIMSFALMALVLVFSNHARLAPFTGVAAGLAVAAFITFEAPFSGMSINPARSFASAAPAAAWQHLWVYCTAPPAGMVLAAGAYRLRWQVRCAKLIHSTDVRCIHCGYRPPATSGKTRNVEVT